MIISICDICEKEAEESLYVGINTPLPNKQICYSCGFLMVEFLKKHKFIKDEKPKTKK